jgi:hypothetical protein
MKEVNYDNYFWQDNGIRLRAIQEEDWEGHYYNQFDTSARRLLESEVELPPTITGAKKFVERFSDFAPGTGRIMFTIETIF